MPHLMRKLNSFDVVILCGGLGQRLRPVTGSRTPKVLASVQGIPFLDILLMNMKDQGFQRVILCAGYRAAEIQEYYQKKEMGLDIVFSLEKNPLGTGGAIKKAKSKIKSSVFFALNGDCFCPISFRDFLFFHKKKKALASLVLSQAKEKKDFGSVQIDRSGRIKDFTEKSLTADSAYMSAGIYCFNRGVFDLMPFKRSFSIENDFFPSLVNKNFFGFVTRESFIDIGTPQRYRLAQKKLKALSRALVS
jgi:D-glycero-alpha-D-manno-heptose 1-phosphate guanylyltransferase